MFSNDILQQTQHRPFPLPEGHWMMTQKWNEVLFAHWPFRVESVRAQIPAQLELDTYEQQAWISLLPFHINQFRLKLLPPFPGASAFPELNVRTYVTFELLTT
jgi:uncharacterized protein